MTIFYYLLFVAIICFIIGFIAGFITLLQAFEKEKKEFVQQREKETSQVPTPQEENSRTDINKIVQQENEIKQKIEEALEKNEEHKTEELHFKDRVVEMKHAQLNDADESSKEKFLMEHRSEQDDAYNFVANSYAESIVEAPENVVSED